LHFAYRNASVCVCYVLVADKKLISRLGEIGERYGEIPITA